jgi:nitric oxide synthase-interacting protein
MTKHSKNNTASSIFSYAEYKKLEYGTKRVHQSHLITHILTDFYPQQRLGNESMRQFDACALCLNRAREPVACTQGHLFCKECVYTDLRELTSQFPPLSTLFTIPVSQKKDIQRQKSKLETLKREAEQEKARAKDAARERVLLDFEKGQLRLAGTSASTAPVAKSSANADERAYSQRSFA